MLSRSCLLRNNIVMGYESGRQLHLVSHDIVHHSAEPQFHDVHYRKEKRKDALSLHLPATKPQDQFLPGDDEPRLDGKPVSMAELAEQMPLNKEDGPVFLDGSCLHGRTAYTRAAAALVQLGK